MVPDDGRKVGQSRVEDGPDRRRRWGVGARLDDGEGPGVEPEQESVRLDAADDMDGLAIARSHIKTLSRAAS